MKKVIILLSILLSSFTWAKDEKSLVSEAHKNGAALGAAAGLGVQLLLMGTPIGGGFSVARTLKDALILGSAGTATGFGVGEVVDMVKERKMSENALEATMKLASLASGAATAVKFVAGAGTAASVGAAAAGGLAGLGVGTLAYNLLDKYILDGVEAVHNGARNLSSSTKKLLQRSKSKTGFGGFLAL